MELYHFSEDPGIRTFYPRKTPGRDDLPPVVWAVDDAHAASYFFPRDCPRIILRKSDAMHPSDRDRFFCGTAADTLILIENAWASRLHSTTLYRYAFSGEGFAVEDANAGYYVTEATVEPLEIATMTDLVGHVLARGIELRYTPDLHPMREAILRSTADAFSIIRFRNAGVLCL
ncbi:DUF6886 family protein [Paenibacillus sp.]|uniref:DUF6886 family protein n=1 Tax=Paenibacillus sp. TaxID=58172 RepID=UPI002D49875A|nr:DUF6886 family protein [Paenibacillus sp.]HZG56614.1 hypothetical protein [Paenibacillus sp.]